MKPWASREKEGEAPVGFEPTIADLQSTALATWRRSQLCSRLSTERRGQGQGAIRRKLPWEGRRRATVGEAPRGFLKYRFPKSITPEDRIFLWVITTLRVSEGSTRHGLVAAGSRFLVPARGRWAGRVSRADNPRYRGLLRTLVPLLTLPVVIGRASVDRGTEATTSRQESRKKSTSKRVGGRKRSTVSPRVQETDRSARASLAAAPRFSQMPLVL